MRWGRTAPCEGGAWGWQGPGGVPPCDRPKQRRAGRGQRRRLARAAQHARGSVPREQAAPRELRAVRYEHEYGVEDAATQVHLDILPVDGASEAQLEQQLVVHAREGGEQCREQRAQHAHGRRHRVARVRVVDRARRERVPLWRFRVEVDAVGGAGGEEDERKPLVRGEPLLQHDGEEDRREDGLALREQLERRRFDGRDDDERQVVGHKVDEGVHAVARKFDQRPRREDGLGVLLPRHEEPLVREQHDRDGQFDQLRHKVGRPDRVVVATIGVLRVGPRDRHRRHQHRHRQRVLQHAQPHGGARGDGRRHRKKTAEGLQKRQWRESGFHLRKVGAREHVSAVLMLFIKQISSSNTPGVHAPNEGNRNANRDDEQRHPQSPSLFQPIATRPPGVHVLEYLTR
eukprot:6418998-Prymnesium_polylepis.1